MDFDITLDVVFNHMAFATSLLFILFMANKYKSKIENGIFGSDGIGQANELLTAEFLIIFPVVLFANLFLDKTVDPEVWEFFKIFIVAIISGKVGSEFINKKFKENG